MVRLVKVLKSWVTGRPSGNYLASIVLEVEFRGGFRVQFRGMRLVKTEGRTILAMPNHKGPHGNWHDIIVLDQPTRDVFEEAAITAWTKQGGDFDAKAGTCLAG